MTRHFDSLAIDNFRGIKDMDKVVFSSVNIITGKPNSGKTSLLEALYCLHKPLDDEHLLAISKSRYKPYIAEDNEVYTCFSSIFFNENDSLKLSLRGSFENEPFEYEFRGTRSISETEDRIEKVYGDLRFKFKDEDNKARLRFYEHIYSISNSLTYPCKHGIDGIGFHTFLEFDFPRYFLYVLDDESYKQSCLELLQKFDPDVEDLFVSEYKEDDCTIRKEKIRHKRLGEVSVIYFGESFRQLFQLFNSIRETENGVLLFDDFNPVFFYKELESVCEFIVEQCRKYNVQLFLSTSSLEVIDGFLRTQHYHQQSDFEERKNRYFHSGKYDSAQIIRDGLDEIAVLTLKSKPNKTYKSLLDGFSVNQDCYDFGFDVRQ